MNKVRLGSHVQIVMGQAPASADCNFEGRGTPFVKVGEFGLDRPIIREWTTNPLKMARKSDVLLCVVGATCGKINLGEDCAIGRSVAAIRPDATVLDQFYLHYFMMTYVVILRAGSVGAAQTVISKEMIQGITIPLPPLDEQRRIVAVLDEAFAGLATMRANAEANLANARALFDSHLNAIFSQMGEGWMEATLGQIADFKNGLNYTQSSKGETIKIVGVKDFQNYFWTPTDGLDSVQIDGDLPPSYELMDGDILTVRSNGNKQLIGRCILVRGIKGKAAHSGFTIRIRVADTRINPVFLTRCLKTDAIRQRLVESGDGANISSLNQKALTVLPIAFPNRDKQNEIVAKIEKFEEETTRLESLYRQKLTAIDELKQSLLQKAFAGELISDHLAA